MIQKNVLIKQKYIRLVERLKDIFRHNKSTDLF